MSWIAVHDEILGSKLRGLRKKIQCSEAEAVGILTLFWLWARNNTDISGWLRNTDKEDIQKMLTPYLDAGANVEMVVNAMIEEHWIDEIDGELYVHDWREWQSYWYKYLNKKAYDAERKRRARERKKAENPTDSPTDSPTDETEKSSEHKAPKPADLPGKADKPTTSKKKKPDKEKTAYAEFVKMLPEEYQKLCSEYGKPATMKAIEILDNYKGANGKNYKSDYRAILNWVIDKIQREYPRLIYLKSDYNTGNPFEEFGEE